MAFVYIDIDHSPGDQIARSLHHMGLLRLHLRSTRKFDPIIPRHLQKRMPGFFLLRSLLNRLFKSNAQIEYCRSWLINLHDSWAMSHLQPGDSLAAGVGWSVSPARYCRQHGGTVVLEARTTHPHNFWTVNTSENIRWGFNRAAWDLRFYLQKLQALKHANYVFCPSEPVRDSYINFGWPKENCLCLSYPVSLDNFRPLRDKPLTSGKVKLCTTGSLDLRKGAPYLFQAVERCLKRKLPIEFHCVNTFHENFLPIYQKLFSSIPVIFHKPMSQAELAVFLRSMDLFCLPSLEEGRARTVLEALASGLPAIITAETGSADLIRDGENGTVITARSARQLELAISTWAARLCARPYDRSKSCLLAAPIGEESFQKAFATELQRVLTIPRQ